MAYYNWPIAIADRVLVIGGDDAGLAAVGDLLVVGHGRREVDDVWRALAAMRDDGRRRVLHHRGVFLSSCHLPIQGHCSFQAKSERYRALSHSFYSPLFFTLFGLVLSSPTNNLFSPFLCLDDFFFFLAVRDL
uniref:Uncharacterized protein n=1 Tax=Oryza brachyantha TaxID=4533 RepID=J3LBI5_ORYBR